MALGVRSLVDACHRNEGEFCSARPQPTRGFSSNVLVDGEPAAHVAAKMSSGRARDERGTLADALAPAQAPADHAQRSEAGLRQLEDGWRRAIDVAIDEPHLGTHVAARVSA